MTADRMPVEHQMLDAAGAPGAWPTHLLVDRLSAVLGELDRCRTALGWIASIDPYNMPADETCPSREAQNWATLNGCVSWARDALNTTSSPAPASSTHQPEEGSPGGVGCPPPGRTPLTPTDAQEGTA